MARFAGGLPGASTPFRVQLWYDWSTDDRIAPGSTWDVEPVGSETEPFIIAVLVPGPSSDVSSSPVAGGPVRLESAIRARADVVLHPPPQAGESHGDLLERGLELARSFLAKRSPRALLAARFLLSGRGAVREGLEAERALFPSFFESGDARDGICAFLKGETPAFARWIRPAAPVGRRRGEVRRRR